MLPAGNLLSGKMWEDYNEKNKRKKWEGLDRALVGRQMLQKIQCYCTKLCAAPMKTTSMQVGPRRLHYEPLKLNLAVSATGNYLLPGKLDTTLQVPASEKQIPGKQLPYTIWLSLSPSSTHRNYLRSLVCGTEENPLFRSRHLGAGLRLAFRLKQYGKQEKNMERLN